MRLLEHKFRKSGFIKLYKADDNNVETWEEVGNLDLAALVQNT